MVKRRIALVIMAAGMLLGLVWFVPTDRAKIHNTQTLDCDSLKKTTELIRSRLLELKSQATEEEDIKKINEVLWRLDSVEYKILIRLER